MELGILGPLRLLDADEPVTIPGGRQHDLIALLATSTGRVVRSDRLIEALWGQQRPAHPDNALQQRIVQIRRLLDPDGRGDVLVTVPGGYRLDVDDDAVDARRFEGLVRRGQQALQRGDHVRAATLLRDALGLWRGEALEGIDAPWARDEARSLEERRLAAWEDRIDADLALGRHDGCVAELERLVAAHPLRERLRGQLMLALAGSGRQADALEVYADGRRALVDELGIDPSPQLQQVHADVLAQRGTAAPPPHEPAALQLPTPGSSFVGRDEELDRLGVLIEQERIVTITGPGGAGKTRLAIETVRRAHGTIPHRTVRFVDLAVLHDGDAVAAAVAAALGVVGHGAMGTGDLSAVEALRSTLGVRSALLVLDNCEHLLPAVCDLVEAVVHPCPGVQVLATSREPLGVDGEIVWPLPTLPVPPVEVRDRVTARTYAAVRLFEDRARAVRPDHQLTDAETGPVVQIVRHLDGLPLAIELAAARTRVLSVTEIAQRLHQRFHLLSGGHRAAPTRHRALWDTLEWSWQLLDQHEQAAWMAAAVPAAPFTADLLDDLLASIDVPLDGLDAVTALCDRSLLTVHERAAPSRYRMLETLREFALEHLAESDLEVALRSGHAGAVEQALSDADTTTAQRWAVDLTVQQQWLPDARTAMRWHAARGEDRALQRIAARLGWLWYLTALAPEGLRWLTQGLGPLPDIDLEDVEPAAVMWAAALRVNEARHDEGLRWAQLAVDASSDDLSGSLAQLFLVIHRSVAGDVEEARRNAHDGGSGGGWVQGLWRVLEAQLMILTGTLIDAEGLLADAEALLLQHGAWWGVWTSASLVQLAQLRGDGDEVQRITRRALQVCSQRGIPELEVELRCLAAMVAATGDDHDHDCDRHLELAQAVVDRTGVAMSRALMANARGFVHRRRGQPAQARAHLERALALHDRAGLVIGRPFTLWVLGHLALEAGDVGDGLCRHAASIRAARDRGDGDAVARGLEGFAAAMLAADQPETAARLLAAAEARRTAMRAPAPVLSRDEVRMTRAQLGAVLSPTQLAEAHDVGHHMQDEEVLRLLPPSGAS